MLTRTGYLLLLAAALLPCVVVAAPDGNNPTVEYSALSTTETEEATFSGMIYHANNKERREMNADGEKMTIITRHDKKKSYMLMPEEKAYMEMAMGQSSDASDLSGYEFEQTVVGPEEINGIKTTKSKIVAKRTKDGSKFGGFWWTTKENIVVKMDMLSIDKDGKARMKMQLTDLKIGKQDPKLFDIPADYSPMSMGMPNMKEMMGQGGEESGEEEAAEAEQPAKDKKEKKKDKESGGFGFKNLLDMAK